MENDTQNSQQAASTALHNAPKLAKIAQAGVQGGPAGAATEAAVQYCKEILVVAIAVLLLPVLVLLMLPGAIFGTLTQPSTAVNDDLEVAANVMQLRNAVSDILQVAYEDTLAEIESERASLTYSDIDDSVGGHVSYNAFQLISMYSAYQGEDDYTKISLADLSAQVQAHRTEYYTYTTSEEVRTEPVQKEVRGQTITVQEDHTYTVFTLSYVGDDYFADTVWQLDDKQKSCADAYAHNLTVYLHEIEEHEGITILGQINDALIDVLDAISIIIPCHDVENYLKRCLDSILSQTITGVKFEIICVDDCSNDNTLSILEYYERQYPDMFIIIPLEQNMKQGFARNLALTYSTGDYITYVDSDDCIDANMFEQLYRYAKLDDCDITECGYTLLYDRDGVPNATASGKLALLHMNNPDDKRYYILNRYWKTSPWGRLYKRSFLVDNNIRFPENIFMEDILFSTECMYYMRSYLLLPANYYFYYGNDNGTMLSDKLKDYYMNTMTMQNMSTDFLKEHDWYSDCYDEYAFMHYKKAFEELLWRMSLHPELYSYENIQLAKNELLTRFPDITNNHFIVSSDSSITQICRSILTHDIPSDELKKVFVQNS